MADSLNWRCHARLSRLHFQKVSLPYFSHEKNPNPEIKEWETFQISTTPVTFKFTIADNGRQKC